MHSLEAKLRSAIAREVRQAGEVPGVVYGKDVPSTSVSVSLSDFTRLYREVGQNHVFTLRVGKNSYSVLLHDMQRHPVSGKPLHLDFLTVNMTQKITVRIPISLIGVSPAVVMGGQLHQTLETLEVRCLPADVVDTFELDVASIEHIGQSLHVRDMKIDTHKFEIITHAEDPVVASHSVKEQKSDKEAPSTAEVEGAAEKKKDDTVA